MHRVSGSDRFLRRRIRTKGPGKNICISVIRVVIRLDKNRWRLIDRVEGELYRLGKRKTGRKVFVSFFIGDDHKLRIESFNIDVIIAPFRCILYIYLRYDTFNNSQMYSSSPITHYFACLHRKWDILMQLVKKIVFF